MQQSTQRKSAIYRMMALAELERYREKLAETKKHEAEVAPQTKTALHTTLATSVGIAISFFALGYVTTWVTFSSQATTTADTSAFREKFTSCSGAERTAHCGPNHPNRVATWNSITRKKQGERLPFSLTR